MIATLVLVRQILFISFVLANNVVTAYFNMNMFYPSKTPMVVRSLDLEKDPFRPRDDEEQILGPKFPYLSVVGALMYLANNTRPDIAFAINLLARHSSDP